MEFELFIQHETARSEIYKQLSESYYPPDETLGRRIKEITRLLEMNNPGSKQYFDVESVKKLKKKDYLELKIDHARLFIGPYTLLAPPYGSVYLDAEHRILGNTTMDAINSYHQAGLMVTKDFKNPPDHIAVELEFLHFLIVKELEAIKNGNTMDLTNTLTCQYSFLDRHLCLWISEFANNVARNARTSFYQNLARATDVFVKDDYQDISEMLNQLQPVIETAASMESLPTFI